MSILARPQASSNRDPLVAALFPRRAAPVSIGDRLARQQFWLEIPTFVGVFAAVLGALFF